MSLKPTISWTPNQDPDLAGYRVYHSVFSDFSDVLGYFEILTPCRSMLRLTSGLTKYVVNYFRVSAFDSSNNESAFSPQVSILVSGGLVMKGYEPFVLDEEGFPIPEEDDSGFILEE